jgi:nicotinamide-nucleotide amidase
MAALDCRATMAYMSAPIHDSAELNAEIVSIGTELLLGEITDTNASWLAGQLPALGIPVYRIQQVGDNQQRLALTLEQAWQRANLLILTGGLGPTEDDLTREAIAEVVGEQMTVIPALEIELRAFFARRGRKMPERNVKQATSIPSATVLDNPIGTAPGWFVRHHGKILAAMPGVPVEMRRMWSEQVVPKLLPFPRGGSIVSRTLKIIGLGESRVEELLGDLVRGANPTVATYAKNDGIHVRVAARAADSHQAASLIGPIETQIRGIFGDYMYGTDDQSLDRSVGHLLEQTGRTIAVAEAGSEGSVCASLSGPAFKGGFVEPALQGDLDIAGIEEFTVKKARRAADSYLATIGVACAISPQAGGAVRISATVVEGLRVLSTTEDQNIAASDIARRALLLVIQVLRQHLLEK